MASAVVGELNVITSEHVVGACGSCRSHGDVVTEVEARVATSGDVSATLVAAELSIVTSEPGVDACNACKGIVVVVTEVEARVAASGDVSANLAAAELSIVTSEPGVDACNACKGIVVVVTEVEARVAASGDVVAVTELVLLLVGRSADLTALHAVCVGGRQPSPVDDAACVVGIPVTAVTTPALTQTR